MTNDNLLFAPYSLNDTLVVKNRIVMAPMTRNMAFDDLSPTSAMADYYAKRADAGLIITEGTIIRPDGRGATNVPGIFTLQHIAGWKKVTTAVHRQGGKIFLQIWHVGRVSHPIFLNGQLPLSASATTMTQRVNRTKDLYYGSARAVTLPEISQLIENYATAARNAIEAGFDGVEIHGANGYLIDQFLHYSTNHREDNYGGTPHNMARFALDVVKACGAAIGFERVGLRLSPGAYLNEIVGDPRDALVFQHLLVELNKLFIAYIHTGNFDDSKQFTELNQMTMTAFMRSYYAGNIIASGSYTFAQAKTSILQGDFDLIAFGRPFIANPNLVYQLARNLPLANYDPAMLTTLN